MEISNLTLGREDWEIFQEKLLLPSIKGVQNKKDRKEKEGQEEKKNQSVKIEEKEIEKKKKVLFEPDNVWIMCIIVKREKYKRKAMITRLDPGV